MSITMPAMIDPNPSLQTHTSLEIRPHVQTHTILEETTSGIQALDVIHSELKAEGIQLLVARPTLYMRRYGEATGIALRVGRENVFPSVRAAVEAMLTREARTDGIPAVEVPDRSFRAFFDNQRRSEQSADPGASG
jgi:STAS domain